MVYAWISTNVHQRLINVTKNGIRHNTEDSFECRCIDGFVGSGVFCKDVNECSRVNHQCGDNTKCKNTIGSFKCPFLEGFSDEDFGACNDLNECINGSHECYKDEVCLNTSGSYKCSCKVGFSRNKDGKCVDINECRYGIDKCNRYAICSNTIGSYECN